MRVKLSLNRAHLVFAHDLAMAAISFPLAMYLRLGGETMPGWGMRGQMLAALALVAVAGTAFRTSGMYKGVWRYASVPDLTRLVRVAAVSLVAFYLLLFLFTRLDGLPRTVPVIHWFVLVALLGGPRFLYRRYKDDRLTARGAGDGTRVPVLLVGAGDEADLFIRATLAADAQYWVVGVISEKGARVGRDIHGIDVLGTIDDLPAIVDRLRAKGKVPQRLIITDHRLDGAVVRTVLDEADRLGLALARIPRLTDLKDGVTDRLDPRPIALEDLLGRPQMVLDRDAMAALIGGRRVLVTGAGGSIGAELVRQIADLRPASLILFDSCEFNLYSIDLEMAGRHPDLERWPVLGDIRDAERVGAAMNRHRPELVFHAAALKHVPMVEYNPDEGLLTNAAGTRIVADSCRAAGVRLMVQISTDKAVNPTNVMGASKRVAEMYTQALDLDGDTRFVTVRFGNVLGSTGSVVPLFQKQLAAGGPLTVTHPDMTRYFMTVREAVELVLQASAFGVDNAAYRGRIFVLDMGAPVRILHLARQMIRLAGLQPDRDIGIVFTGLRPGEKLFEEIFHGAEPPQPTERGGILVAAARSVDRDELGMALSEMEQACRAHQPERAMAVLRRLVPEYRPDGEAPAAAAAAAG
jgi:O-antigen biosynthesis protein WbqV